MEELAFVTESEARRLWSRASELQSEQSRHVEERSRDLRDSGGLTPLPSGEHLAVDVVLDAGREVGIEERFLRAAFDELVADRARGQDVPPDAIDRAASRFLGNPPSVVEVSRTIPASQASVLRAMQRVFPVNPFCLRLRDALGDRPLQTGVLVFDAPASTSRVTYSRRHLMAGGRIARLYATVRPVAEDGQAPTRVTLRGSVEADHEPAFWLGSSLTLGSTGVGAVLGAAAAAGFGFIGLWAAAGALAAAMVFGGTTFASFRHRYQGHFERSDAGLRELLDVVEATVNTDGAFLSSGDPAQARVLPPDRASPTGSW